MQIEMQTFHDVQYQTLAGFTFIPRDITVYPSFCGAGDGIGDKIVPEYIGGMRCSHICHIHDDWWERCEATKLAFIRSNIAFGYNLITYLSTGRGTLRERAWRVIKAAGYVAAVSTIGWGIFKGLKGL